MQFDRLKRREFITLADPRGSVAARCSRASQSDGSHFMGRQRLIILIMLMSVALSSAATTQNPPQAYHLGLLGCGPPPSNTGDIVAGLIRGLAQRGYVLDRNVVFERRGAQFHFDRLPGLVDELLASRVE